MSWLKRRGQTTSPNPSSAPPVQLYNPNQHSNLQSQWQQQDLQAPSSNNWYSQTQSNQQSLQQPSYSQPVLEPFDWNRSYTQHPTTAFNPISSNQSTEQYSPYNSLNSNRNSTYQQKNYANQHSQNPTYSETVAPQPHVNSDSWSWGWGDEDNSNIQNLPQANPTFNINNLKSSNEETWNWTVEDSNTNSTDTHVSETRSHFSNSTNQNSAHQNIQHIGIQSNTFPQMGKLAEKHSQPDGVYSQDPNLEHNINKIPSTHSDHLSHNQTVVSSTSKHNKTDHLTPQWSTESQLSQDSSDLLHTSESDKSHMLSRSSTISESPVSGHDINPENVITQESPQNRHQETCNVQNMTEASSSDSVSMNYYRQDTYSLHQENKEDISGLRDELKQYKSNQTAPPPMKNPTPPHVLPPTDDVAQNPYKLNSGLSHNKSANRHNLDRQTGTCSVNQLKYPLTQSPFNQSVNLETLPDNSEQPDTISPISEKVKPSMQQWPENNEVAPINDRNQYLETGQLSNNDFNQPPTSSLNDTSDSIPPPGFPRMVLGQMEQVDNLGNQDEPPPGLSRMVLGETCTTSPIAKIDNTEPLHRMIPGGSSSPKPMSRYQPTNYSVPKFGDTSESDLNAPTPNQIRSATIGADTPSINPNVVSGASVSNRSKTIGADITMPYSSSNLENIKSNSKILSASNNFNNNIRETNLDGANNLDEKIIKPVAARRDSIEGEPQDSSLSNLVNSIRDLNVGESLSNGTNSTMAVTERTTRRPSKQESTDSEQESGRMPRERKDRRFYEKHGDYDRDRNKRYSPSPDRYREKKYERMRYSNQRYDDESDYYSDKERDRKRNDKDRREELDRKYGSLKRDKEKEKRRKEPRNYRDYGRDGHRKEYYHRYEDEYDDHSRSRPSSRSDSLHDSYRQDRDRHRERDKYRRHRDQYNMPYMQGYTYDPYNPYYQQYQYHYYENLRRTNPQAYAEWYRKYYQQNNSQQNFGNEDRASVHSGRSSANEELSKDRYTRQSYYNQASLNYYREPHIHSILDHYAPDESRPFDQTDSSLCLEDTTVTSQRLTPAKFATAHTKASITSGRLVKVFPHYPLDGQPAVVEIDNVKELLVNDDEYKELAEFPGPLIKGVTHKKTIIEYCENKIRNAIYTRVDIGDVDSYILMWELLILLLRQNGMVVGTDIAELLMKDKKQEYSRKASVTSNSSGLVEPTAPSEQNMQACDLTGSSASILKEEVVTNKFRELLIYGSEKEALEWSMKHGLWGHALFLASKLDKRTYANVMTRFANGLTMNDPLQTLYQLLSGKMPASVTVTIMQLQKPHLAMILSNTTQRPELDRKAIMTLGDTLLNRNSLYAAQFSYLMAQVEFSRYGTEAAKLVLLGSNHSKPFMEFAINEAIFMTEVYEYACSLNDNNFVIPEFLPYKYLLATRLADRGLLEKSLAYLEKIAVATTQNPAIAQPTLIRQVCALADKLKYCDLIEDSLEGDAECDNRPDNTWLKDMKTVERNYNIHSVPQGSATESLEPITDIGQSQIAQSSYEQSWSHQYIDDQYQQHQQWQPVQYEQQNNIPYQPTQNTGTEGYTSELYPDQQSYWTQNQLSENTEHVADSQQFTTDLQSQNSYWNSASAQDIPSPQISMPHQSRENSALDQTQKQESSSQQIKKESPLKQKAQDKPATTGWFGGIWNKLSLRPKNQMKLPDDKNPTIVWDEQKKRWINLESEGDGAATELKPPPKMTDMYSMTNQAMPTISATAARQQDNLFHNVSNMVGNQKEPSRPLLENGMIAQNVNTSVTQNNIQTVSQKELVEVNDEGQSKMVQPNMFKLQRGRNIKKSYVDVFNPGAKNSGNASSIAAPEAFPSLSSNGLQMNYFVPAPVSDPNAPTDFLTPAPVPQLDDNSQVR
ncbi:hypothetical protein RI129_000906 [Pyrocoelia pectoralis]|uniref:Protein transport protein sec16 n=1 Tax=Pyrocoelia pectoralis TaxID=417401 RepID=A0AAN7ZRT9_9COLE